MIDVSKYKSMIKQRDKRDTERAMTICNKIPETLKYIDLEIRNGIKNYKTEITIGIESCLKFYKVGDHLDKIIKLHQLKNHQQLIEILYFYLKMKGLDVSIDRKLYLFVINIEPLYDN